MALAAKIILLKQVIEIPISTIQDSDSDYFIEHDFLILNWKFNADEKTFSIAYPSFIFDG